MYRSPVLLIQPRRHLFSSIPGKDTPTTYRLSKRVAVPPSLLFQVVSDVARYREFVPFVTESFIDDRDEITELPTQGGFRVGWKEFDERFVCKLECTKDKRVVAESLTTQLFHHLRNEWTFQPAPSRLSKELQTIVYFTLRFQFKNLLYNAVSSLFQDRVSQTMMEAFEKRAKELEKNDVNK